MARSLGIFISIGTSLALYISQRLKKGSSEVNKGEGKMRSMKGLKKVVLFGSRCSDQHRYFGSWQSTGLQKVLKYELFHGSEHDQHSQG